MATQSVGRTGSAQMAAAAPDSLPPFYFVVTFWGERYRNWFVRYALASLLAPNNIPAIDNLDACKFLISTTKEDWNALQKEPLFKKLKKIISVHHLSNEAPEEAEHKYARMSRGHKSLLEKCFKDRACAIYLACATLFPDGSVQAAQELVRQGKKVVLCTAIRFNLDGIDQELRERGLFVDGQPLILSRREASYIGLRNFHPESEAGRFEAGNFGALHQSHGRRDFATCCWFDVKDEDGIIIYTHNWAPFSINFSAIEKHDTTVLDVWAVDGDYIHKNFPSAQIGDDIYVVTDSDEIILLGMTPGDEMVPPSEPESIKTLPIIGYWVRGCIINHVYYDKWVDPLRRSIYPTPVIWHANDINQRYILERRRSKKIILRFTYADFNPSTFFNDKNTAKKWLFLTFSRQGWVALCCLVCLTVIFPGLEVRRRSVIYTAYALRIISALSGDLEQRQRILDKLPPKEYYFYAFRMVDAIRGDKSAWAGFRYRLLKLISWTPSNKRTK